MQQHFRPNGIVLQPRDYALLQGLLDSRLMTLKHAAALHFEGKIEAAKKRLQKLHAAGFIFRRARRPQDPAVYTLGRAGYLNLKRAGLIDSAHDPGWAKLYKRQSIGDLMLAHELAVMDVKVSFVTAIAARPDLELAEISTSPDRHKFRVVEAVPAKGGGVRFRSLFAKPDGFLHVSNRDEAARSMDRFIFLEIDRGTESHRRLLDKLRHYDQLRRKGGAFGPASRNHKDHGRFFILLIVFHSETRMANFVSSLQAACSRRKSRARFATIKEVLAHPLDFLR